ncbi:MAG: GYD domain-containing protein [Dehalococcoidia bacterium]|nr:GYD domain-containing protein [Dehalococcoidia bacterium]
MPTYIMFFGFSQQGIQNIKDSPARVEAAKKSFESIGAKVKEFYAVMGMGQFDTMFILEAPNNEVAAEAALSISALGYVHTNTLPAFTEAEYKKMIAKLR